MEYLHFAAGKQASKEVASALGRRLEGYLAPLLQALDSTIDQRLVRTFFALVEVILQFRHASYGLLLSEMGGYVGDPAHAPAGTKRLSNLLRCRKWSYAVIERFLWRQAEQGLETLEAAGETGLVIWDESEWEKPESLALEGLCPVRSSKARRLTRIKPGYDRPPGKPIFVPGVHWLGVLLAGRVGPPQLAALRWWTSRGKYATERRTVEAQLLDKFVQQWAKRVVHLFDRGFAGEPWLTQLAAHEVRFVMRWPAAYKLLDAEGRSRKAWQIARGKRSWGHRQMWDTRRRCWRKVGIVAVPVTHPAHPAPLWLVLARPGQGRSPWYLLTNEPAATLQATTTVVFAYARRWQIEMAWRFSKSELAFQSPRLWSCENRLKLLFIATLAFAFLLSLLHTDDAPLRTWLLRFWCHRTGKRCQDASAPLYRLRSALSHLWLAFLPPPLAFSWRNSG
jgi:hypothetical protein